MSTKLSLNVFMDKQKSKVIFAEADGNFVDALLAFLACPLGKIVQIWYYYYKDEAPVFGSLDTLCKSLLHDVNVSYISSLTYLDSPISSLVDTLSRIQLDISQSQRVKYYVCENKNCAESPASNVRMNYSHAFERYVVSCDCGTALKRQTYDYYAKSPASNITNQSSFIIFDDLPVVPNLNGFVQTLNNLGITDTDDIEMVTLSFNISDMRNLFKLALFSTTPLTDLATKNTENISTVAKPELFHLPEKNPVSHISKKMILKVSLQKSTNKFLFAQAAGDFIEFLYSLLFIPVGGVEYLFGGNTAFKSMDNLYTSVRDEIDCAYFVKPRIRNTLINPELPYGYNFRNQFLILREENPPALYIRKEGNEMHLYDDEKLGTLVSLKLSYAKDHFFMEKAMCIVSDDLSVRPYTTASAIELLKGMGIRLSDVKEMELEIGFEEALRILKAALTSKTVLTDALINPMLKKMPKVEH